MAYLCFSLGKNNPSWFLGHYFIQLCNFCYILTGQKRMSGYQDITLVFHLSPLQVQTITHSRFIFFELSDILL